MEEKVHLRNIKMVMVNFETPVFNENCINGGFIYTLISQKTWKYTKYKKTSYPSEVIWAKGLCVKMLSAMETKQNSFWISEIKKGNKEKQNQKILMFSWNNCPKC